MTGLADGEKHSMIWAIFIQNMKVTDRRTPPDGSYCAYALHRNNAMSHSPEIGTYVKLNGHL